MHIVPIDDPADARLRDYVGLTDVVLRRLTRARRRAVPGRVGEGHRARPGGRPPAAFGAAAAEVARRARAAARAATTSRCSSPSPDVLEQVTGFVMHRGALASMHRPRLPAVAETCCATPAGSSCSRTSSTTPTSGAIFRAVAGLGADAVLVTPRCADPFYRRSVRVSMGTVLQIPWTRLAEWPDGADQLHDAGFEIAALALDDGAVDLATFAQHPPDRVALLLGTEGDGLSRAALEACRHRRHHPDGARRRLAQRRRRSRRGALGASTADAARLSVPSSGAFASTDLPSASHRRVRRPDPRPRCPFYLPMTLLAPLQRRRPRSPGAQVCPARPPLSACPATAPARSAPSASRGPGRKRLDRAAADGEHHQARDGSHRAAGTSARRRRRRAVGHHDGRRRRALRRYRAVNGKVVPVQGRRGLHRARAARSGAHRIGQQLRHDPRRCGRSARRMPTSRRRASGWPHTLCRA